MASAKQSNIFSYFNKTPTGKNSPASNNGDQNCKEQTPVRSNRDKAVASSNDSPKSAISQKSTPTSCKNKIQPVQIKSKFGSAVKSSRIEAEQIPDDACEFKPGDLVWGRLEGYPWWPCLVCNHPKDSTHLRRRAKQLLIHVQFFDCPPTRGWIKTKFTKLYEGSDCKEFKRGGTFFSTDPACRKAVDEADSALQKSTQDRLNLVVVTDSSNDEDEEDVGNMKLLKFVKNGVECENDNIEDLVSDNDIKEERDDIEVSSEKNGKKNKNSASKIKNSKIDCKKEEMEVDGEEAPEKADGKENRTPPEEGGNSLSSRKPKRGTSERMVGARSAKRRRIIVESDEEEGKDENNDTESDNSQSDEDEFKPCESESESESESEGEASEELESSHSSDEQHSPVKAKSKKSSNEKKEERNPQGVLRKCAFSALKSPAASKKSASPTSSAAKAKQSKISTADTSFTSSELAGTSSSGGGGGATDDRNFSHLAVDFLQPDKIRDADKRRPTDPEYNPRTVHIPDSFLAKQTPAHHQWWLMKKDNFDTILFFKMGKFYELFHMDAVIAVNELGLIFMRGEFAHCGFPEIAYSRYADVLIQKGYKVARIEQTETPDMMNERCKQMGRGTTKFDKVVRREICSVQTRGTKRFSFIDGDLGDSGSHYLLAICEKAGGEMGGGSIYGVCFVETSVSKVYIGQFTDDRHCSRLRTLISHYPPSQVLYERGKLSDSTRSVLDGNLATALKEGLKSGSEFWDASKTLKTLAESEYFVPEDSNTEDRKVLWPEALQGMILEGDSLMQKPAVDCDLALSSLGAVVWYLRLCLLDEELLTMKNFERYIPVDELHCSGSTPQSVGASWGSIDAKEGSTVASQALVGASRGSVGAMEGSFSASPAESQTIDRPHMVLDSITMANLELLSNSCNGSLDGTLLEKLQHCSTPFGKRLLKQWICTPLCNVGGINARLDAVEDLMGCSPDLLSGTTELLRKLPDLERLLSKIHTLGLARRSQNHPDSRAIFFEDTVYSKRKIDDLLITLDGFKTASTLVSVLSNHSADFRSKLLLRCLRTTSSESDMGFPDLNKELAFFDNAFDHQKAKKAGVIKPSKGVNPNYDRAMCDMDSITEELDQYLEEQKKLLKCKNITYWGTGRNRFQMEVPDSALKAVPDEYEVTSQRKGYRRYHTEDIKDMLARLSNAEERRDSAQRDTMRCVFNQFDKHYELWSRAIERLSVLDVLLSLTYYSRNADGFMCRPVFVNSDQPFIEIKDGRHPCITRTFGGGDFIPNDSIIGLSGADDDSGQTAARIVIVTGPNMGGKSTLMRQVGLLVLLAQLGCYVPAESCRLTLVDRIFTRLGATDRIMSGESTFFVELSETASILQHATKHSLVLLDELGRGTATYDGNAIACAVVKELSDNIRCRTLFSTHYHSLVEEFSRDKNVKLGHMACMVENENDSDPSQEMITFLYKFSSGACPKSYGFNAARLAQIPDEIIRVAHHKAAEFEESVRVVKLFRDLWTGCESDSTFDVDTLREALSMC